MKFAAHVTGRPLEDRFARKQLALEIAAIEAAAEALAILFEIEREREGLHAPLRRTSAGKRRFVGAGDSESLARELGSPRQAPARFPAGVDDEFRRRLACVDLRRAEERRAARGPARRREDL